MKYTVHCVEKFGLCGYYGIMKTNKTGLPQDLYGSLHRQLRTHLLRSHTDRPSMTTAF